MDEAEAAVVGDDNTNPADWTAEQVRTVELMQRYKTTMEQAFYRALNACEQARKDEIRRAIVQGNLREKLSRKNREVIEKEQEAEELERKIKRLEPEPGPQSEGKGREAAADEGRAVMAGRKAEDGCSV